MTVPEIDSPVRLKWPEMPYKGFSYYGPLDAPLFAGREKEVRLFGERVAHPGKPIVLLHGNTGCGKSSFLRAGVIPYLEGPVGQPRGFSFMRSSDGETVDSAGPSNDETKAIFIRSTDTPFEKLCSAVFQYAQALEKQVFQTADGEATYDFSEGKAGAESAEQFLLAAAKSTELLLGLLRDIAFQLRTTKLVLVVDQGEEVLTIKPDPSGDTSRQMFFEFLSAFGAARLPLKLIVALRTEYFGKFDARIRGSASRPSQVDSYFLDNVGEEGLLTAIMRPTLTEPVGLYGAPRQYYRFFFQAGLPRRIVSDLQDVESAGGLVGGALPILQVVCETLFRNTSSRGKDGQEWEITLDDYKKLGTVEQQLVGYLDQVFLMFFRAKGLSETEAINQTFVWKDALVVLSRTQVDGTIVTDLKTADELRAETRDLGARDFDEFLRYLADDEQSVLRSERVRRPGRGDTTEYFSLRHDAIGLALNRWRVARSSYDNVFSRIAGPLRISMKGLFWASIGGVFFSLWSMKDGIAPPAMILFAAATALAMAVFKVQSMSRVLFSISLYRSLGGRSASGSDPIAQLLGPSRTRQVLRLAALLACAAALTYVCSDLAGRLSGYNRGKALEDHLSEGGAAPFNYIAASQRDDAGILASLRAENWSAKQSFLELGLEAGTNSKRIDSHSHGIAVALSGVDPAQAAQLYRGLLVPAIYRTPVDVRVLGATFDLMEQWGIIPGMGAAEADKMAAFVVTQIDKVPVADRPLLISLVIRLRDKAPAQRFDDAATVLTQKWKEEDDQNQFTQSLHSVVSGLDRSGADQTADWIMSKTKTRPPAIFIASGLVPDVFRKIDPDKSEAITVTLLGWMRTEKDIFILSSLARAVIALPGVHSDHVDDAAHIVADSIASSNTVLGVCQYDFQNDAQLLRPNSRYAQIVVPAVVNGLVKDLHSAQPDYEDGYCLGWFADRELTGDLTSQESIGLVDAVANRVMTEGKYDFDWSADRIDRGLANLMSAVSDEHLRQFSKGIASRVAKGGNPEALADLLGFYRVLGKRADSQSTNEILADLRARIQKPKDNSELARLVQTLSLLGDAVNSSDYSLAMQQVAQGMSTTDRQDRLALARAAEAIGDRTPPADTANAAEIFLKAWIGDPSHSLFPSTLVKALTPEDARKVASEIAGKLPSETDDSVIRSLGSSLKVLPEGSVSPEALPEDSRVFQILNAPCAIVLKMPKEVRTEAVMRELKNPNCAAADWNQLALDLAKSANKDFATESAPAGFPGVQASAPTQIKVDFPALGKYLMSQRTWSEKFHLTWGEIISLFLLLASLATLGVALVGVGESTTSQS